MSDDPKVSDRAESLFDSFVRAPTPPAAGPGAPGGAAPPGPAAPEPPQAPPPPGIWCSDCRTVMRTHYFTLGERPVCARCRQPYQAKVDQGTGSAALGRAVLYGLGAAMAGAALLGMVVLVFGFGRVLCALAIGYLVGRAVSKATGDYGGRIYQVLAVTLTYFAIGLGSLAPVVKAAHDAKYEARHSPKAPASARRATADDGETAAAADDETAAKADDEAAASETLAVADREGDTVAGRAPSRLRASATSPDAANAARLGAGGFFAMLGVALALMFTLPLLSLFTYGLYGAVIGIAAFGYGMYKAWQLTERAVDTKLGGPYRVGTGPVKATV